MKLIIVLFITFLLSPTSHAKLYTSSGLFTPSPMAYAVIDAIKREIAKRSNFVDRPMPKAVEKKRHSKTDDKKQEQRQTDTLIEDEESLVENEDNSLKDQSQPAKVKLKLLKQKSTHSKIDQIRQENRKALFKRDEQIQKKQFVKAFTKQKSLDELFIEELAKLNIQAKGKLNIFRNRSKKYYQKWRAKAQLYKSNIKSYEKTTFELESFVGKSNRESKLKEVSFSDLSGIEIVPGAFDIQIKDQGKRPTCAAFSGTRAIETFLAGHGKILDLSEQYFYWSSKPKCQTTKCQRSGSWVDHGYLKSIRSNVPDIPRERHCRYVKTDNPQNTTQTPLSTQCLTNGKVKVLDYRALSNKQEILSALKWGFPVIVGFKLSPNFYLNSGLILKQEKAVGHRMDNHSKEHALVLLGIINLPADMIAQEGKFCFIIANSWGEGWGLGGFSCISEAWFNTHYLDKVSVSLNAVDYTY